MHLVYEMGHVASQQANLCTGEYDQLVHLKTASIMRLLSAI